MTTDHAPESTGDEPLFDAYDLDKYADVALWALGFQTPGGLKKSALVLIDFDPPALPLAETLVEKLSASGMLPIPRQRPSARMLHARLAQANRKRLIAETPGERELYAALSGLIRIIAPEAPRGLLDVNPELQKIADKARNGVRTVLRRREEAGELARTTLLYPTQGLAELAGVSLPEYAAAVKKACLLDRGTPVVDWKLLVQNQRAVLDKLNALDAVAHRIRASSFDLLIPHGTGRVWTGITGKNLPSYEIGLAPDWRGVEGGYFANAASWRLGMRVKGLKLEFRLGHIAQWKADEGDAATFQEIRTDQGADKVGEFSLVDKRFSPLTRPYGHPLLDENVGGEFGGMHIALGQSDIQDPGERALVPTLDAQYDAGYNQSLLHWDLVNTEDKTVVARLADGSKRLIYESGRFVL